MYIVHYYVLWIGFPTKVTKRICVHLPLIPTVPYYASSNLPRWTTWIYCQAQIDTTKLKYHQTTGIRCKKPPAYSTFLRKDPPQSWLRLKTTVIRKKVSDWHSAVIGHWFRRRHDYDEGSSSACLRFLLPFRCAAGTEPLALRFRRQRHAGEVKPLDRTLQRSVTSSATRVRGSSWQAFIPYCINYSCGECGRLIIRT